MSCDQFRPFIVDVARDAVAAAVEADIERHVRGCAPCRAVLDRERMLSAALRRMAHVEVPPIDPDRERALVAAFDRAVAAPHHRGRRYRIWVPAAAAVLALAAATAWRRPAAAPDRGPARERMAAAARTAPSPAVVAPDPAHEEAPIAEAPPPRRAAGPRRPASRPDDGLDDAVERASFVTWPDAAAGPPLESGTLVRVDLPVSILPALGLWPPASAESTVPVEILVGQDGFARAFRLLQN